MLLLHGYPETKRIWWRNIEPLAAAGFEVIVPDLRGYGDSDLSADDVYDLARVLARRARAGARRARPRAVHRRRWRHRRCGRRRPRAPLRRLRRALLLLQHGAAGGDRGVRRRGARLRVAERVERRSDRRLPRAAGRTARRAGGDAPDRCRAPAVDRRHVHEPVVGVAGNVRSRRPRLHDRALRRRGAPAGRVVGVPARATAVR